MQETVLITGGSGLVGSHLSNLLISGGYKTRHISRRCNGDNKTPCFEWNLETGKWDPNVIKGVKYIIHLAGANVAEGRWTARRKAEILDTRVLGSQLVCEMVEASKGAIKSVVSASAVGYYGIDKGDESVDEKGSSGNDFLADVCVQWEKAISDCNASVVILRTGVVLSMKGGAVPKMLTPIKLGVGSPLGSGDQLMPWIHIDDLCRMYLFAIKNDLKGVYNAISNQIITNKEFTHQLASTCNRSVLFPNVPSFVLKILVGEMANMLLTGVNASASKINNAGFKFNYPSLSLALNQLIKSK